MPSAVVHTKIRCNNAIGLGSWNFNEIIFLSECAGIAAGSMIKWQLTDNFPLKYIEADVQPRMYHDHL